MIPRPPTSTRTDTLFPYPPPCRSRSSAASSLRRRLGGGLGGRVGRDRGGVHPHHFPDMAIGILETAAVHEAEILRRGRVGLAARLDRLVDLSVDLLAAVGRYAEQDLRVGARVGNRLRGEGRPFFMR